MNLAQMNTCINIKIKLRKALNIFLLLEELLTSDWKDVVTPSIVIQNNKNSLPLPKVPVHTSNKETKKRFIGMSLIIRLNENLLIQLRLALPNLFLI